jgi:hypothetical protein
MVAPPPSHSPNPPTLTLPPSITVGHLQPVVWGRGRPTPGPQSSPQTLSASLEVWGWEVKTVCMCVYGGGRGRGQAPPSPNGSLYRNIDEMGISLISRLLLRRLVSFRAFSYGAYFHSARSPTALSFIPRILLWRLSSFRAFSYGT